MKAYTVFYVGDDIILFINNSEDLYYLYDLIFSDLSENVGERFSVVIDLFLRNGFSFNRFVSLTFNGKDNIISHIINPRDIPEEIKCVIRSYLKKNLELLEESSLPKKIINYIQIA